MHIIIDAESALPQAFDNWPQSTVITQEIVKAKSKGK